MDIKLITDGVKLRKVEVNGNEYDPYRDLIYMGETKEGETRPYIRFGTKKEVYGRIKNDFPNEYEWLEQKAWFSKYLKEKEVEEIATETGWGEENMLEKLNEQNNKNLNKMLDKMEDIAKRNTKLEEALIEGIVNKGKELAVEDLKNNLKKELDVFIKETYGAVPTIINVVKENVEYKKIGIFHKEFERVLKLVNMNLPVMLTGGAGAGKNFMLEQVADALNMSFYYTSTITQEYKLTGFIDGGGKYHETEFYKAFTQGGIFMLDEIDASIPEALVIMNGAIANGYFDFPIGRELAHEDFRVVCAGNTVGLGADMVYTGRNVLDGATLDRFVLIDIDYDNRIEEMLCADDELREFLYNIRASVKSNKINHIIGMRAFKYSYEMLINGFDKTFIINSVIFKGLQEDDINIIKNNLDKDNEWYEAIKK